MLRRRAAPLRFWQKIYLTTLALFLVCLFGGGVGRGHRQLPAELFRPLRRGFWPGSGLLCSAPPRISPS